jgi:type IV pilus assembly protein PilQ
MSAFVWIDNVAVRMRAIRTGMGLLFAAFLLAVPGQVAAQMANTIDTMTVSKGTSGRTIVKFTLKAPLANPPAGFSTTTPARVALDFPDTANGLGRTAQEIGDPALRSVNIVQAGNRTRVVFNLNKPQTFETQLEGNTVLVTLFDQTDTADVKTQTVQRFAEVRPGDVAPHTVRDVDFRRGQNGEGRIIVELSDNATGIDVRQQGKSLIVDFIGTTLPRMLARRLDVQDFATPVVTVDTFTQGNNTRMVIEPKGLWEHSAYQADNRFILEVKPIVEDPNKLTQGSRQGYKGDKLSLNFQNVEVRAVLQVIADFTGLNIITSDTVTGNLTLRLKEVPWDQALDIIMQTKGLDMRKNGNIVLIAPREELALKEKQQLEAQAQIAQLEPLISESFQLNYIKAADLAALVVGGRGGARTVAGTGPGGAGGATATGGAVLSERGTVLFDPRTNILFVQDIASRLEDIRRIIRQIDTPIRQVLIEARIVVAKDTFSRQLGVRLGVQTGATLFGRRYSFGTGGSLTTTPVIHLPCSPTTGCTRTTETQTPYELASGLASAGYSNDPQLNIVLPASAIGGFTPASVAMTLINLGSGNLINLELQALEADNKGKVVSSPRVVTGDNQKAAIEQGTEIPYTTSGGIGNVATTSFKKAVLRLEVTPQITPDNRIIMGVEIRKDSVGANIPQQGGGSVPSIDTRNVITQISVNNGDTAVIGGIFEENINTDITKVPLLGDIPFLGYLFKTTGRTTEKIELLIFLTPRVVKDTLTAVR